MKVKTNYNLGDDVWFMDQNRPQCGKVTYVYITVTGDGRHSVSYLFNHSDAPKRAEETLYSTKQELLNTL